VRAMASRGNRVAPVAALAMLVAVATPARAYTVETAVTTGCHEAITMSALRDARIATKAAAPLPLVTGDDRAMEADLPYTPDGDMQDLGAIALVLGVRDNDLKGASAEDLDELAIIQADPAKQDEHCLRSSSDVEPNGTTESLAQCRAFILGKVTSALAYLDAAGNPDANNRMTLQVTLVIRGQANVPLPGFYVNMGQAMHAVEDSFAHSFRATETGDITATLNYVNLADGTLNQEVNGPPHRIGLDECTGLDADREAKLVHAEWASRALLLAALGPGTQQQRIAKANEVLDMYLGYKSGCTYANNWCDAPEQSYEEQLGCAMGRSARSFGVGISLLLLAIAMVARRQLRRARDAVALAPLLLLGLPLEARADEGTPPAPSDTFSAPTPASAQASPFGLSVAAGGALDHTALAFALGARLRLTHAWLLGLDAEWNPWISLTTPKVDNGSFNAYASVIHRWTDAGRRFDLRTSLRVGSSTELTALFGVPLGSTGVYVGGSILGVELRLSKSLSLVIDPGEIAFPVPQLQATPFGYRQYRVMVGLQWGGTS